MGISGVTHRWVSSYLENRSQCTVANGYVSDIQQIVCGVPQGCILGPLLFLAYINDIDSGIDGCDVRLYADDTVIYAGAPEI